MAQQRQSSDPHKKFTDRSYRRSRSLSFESLDSRTVLTAVAGSVFHDVNGDGVRTDDELGLTGWQVTLRSTSLGQTHQQVTDNQQFRFDDVAADSYDIELDATDRWETTFAPRIVLDASQPERPLDLGVRLIAPLRELTFHDMDINLDTYVDDSDLMQAWKSGKLNSGLPAKWEDGDWNQNGRFEFEDLIMYAEAYSILTGPGAVSQLQAFDIQGPADTTFRYDAATGDVSIVAVGFEIAGIQLRASTPALDFAFAPGGGDFTLFQHHASDQYLYWAEFRELPSLNQLDWPRFLTPGLSQSTILRTLQIDGARIGGGGLGRVVLDCVNCPSSEQTIVTVQFYHDENGDGELLNERLVRAPAVEVSDRVFPVQPIGSVVGQPRWYQYQFFVSRDVAVTISVHAPGGWALQTPAAETIHLVPSGDEALLQVGLRAAQLRITEIHYAPLAFGLSEFLELTNFSDFEVSLAGVYFDQGITFSFPNDATSVIGPGQRMVLVSDVGVFRRVYSDPSIVITGQYQGRLSNDGETIELRNFDAPIHTITFDDEWYPQTDERGMSLTLGNVSTHTADQAGDWRPSAVENGTPGRSPYVAGDANHDGVFDSADLVLVFAAGKYEDTVSQNASWVDGDWDGDQEFSTADLVYAFQAGLYIN